METAGTIENENYKFTLDVIDGYPFCHIEIKRWSKSIYDKMLEDLVQVEDAIGTLYAFIEKEKLKERKLANMFGFIEEQEINGGYIMRLS